LRSRVLVKRLTSEQRQRPSSSSLQASVLRVPVRVWGGGGGGGLVWRGFLQLATCLWSGAVWNAVVETSFIDWQGADFELGFWSGKSHACNVLLSSPFFSPHSNGLFVEPGLLSKVCTLM
jgi:hypothetical protein